MKIAAALFLLVTPAAYAQAPSPAAQPSTGAAAPVPGEKPVCRRQETLGSFVPKRVCHSRADWAAIDRAGAATSESALNRRRAGMSALTRD